VAVVGLSLEIAYFWLSGGDLRAGIGWDLIFISKPLPGISAREGPHVVAPASF